MTNYEVGHDVDTEGSWAVSYGDMITLLLTFFIVFFTLDPNAEQQSRALSLRMSLVEMLNHSSRAPAAETSEMSVGKENLEGISREVLKKWNGVAHDRGSHVIVEFPSTSFFRSAETEVTKSGAAEIENFVKAYLPYAGNYVLGVRAFTDPRPVKNGVRFKDNLELSALRSVATMRVLQKSGIPLDRIKLGGYGELKLTLDDLNSIPEAQRTPTAIHDLARKIVLVIEPEAQHD